MAFVKGQSGNPGGRSGEKQWREAIRRALARRSAGDLHGIDKLADALLDAAESGDIVALKEFGDRIDGKPHQTVSATVRDARHLTDAELIAVLQEGSGEGASSATSDQRVTH